MKVNKSMLPLLAFYGITTVAILALGKWLRENDVDTTVLLAGNTILMLSALLAFWMYGRAMNKGTAHGFVKHVYGGFMIKFFVLIVAAMLYFYFASDINKRAVFACMGLYLIYNFLGTSQTVRGHQKNAPKNR